MSNQIFIDKESYEALNEWTAQNKKYALIDDYFFKKCELIFQKSSVVAYAEVKKNNEVRINVKLGRVQAVKVKIIRTPGGENDYQIGYNLCTDEISNEEVAPIIQTVANTFLMVNGFLIFGNMLENREIKAVGKNKGESKVIVFRKYKERFYAIPVRAHRSPEGVFSVRGHIRHYKNGKTIWIDSFLKGVGRKNE